MTDYRLQVFLTVAEMLNFTKAAAQLQISQPAVSRHIRELESQLNKPLLVRNGSRTELTAAGKTLLKYGEKIKAVYREMEYEINEAGHTGKGKLKIGASTTIAQYVLPEVLAGFNLYYKNIQADVSISNSETILKLLEKNKIDIGIIEGKIKSKAFNYTLFKKDEIVLVAGARHPLAHKTIELKDLYGLNFVMRETGSGTQEHIVDALQKEGIHCKSLATTIKFANGEAIKNYLLHSDCVAFLSINAIMQELKLNTLCIIDIKGFAINRAFHFVLPRGNRPAMVRSFLKFAHNI